MIRPIRSYRLEVAHCDFRLRLELVADCDQLMKTLNSSFSTLSIQYTGSMTWERLLCQSWKDEEEMSEELELLKDVAERLESAGIEYMMTGSMAMAIYSIPRMTRDIDIVINVSSADVGRIVALFQDDFYVDEASVHEAIQNKGMFNVIHNRTVMKIDFIVRKDEEYRIGEFSRRIKIDIEGVSISVVTPEDLILSKLAWAKRSGSELQMSDVRRMMSVTRDIDDRYIRKWSKVLGVEGLLREGGMDE